MRKHLALTKLFVLVLAMMSRPAVWAGPESPLAEKADTDALKGYGAFVESVMKEWKIPGLAVAIIKDDEVILSKGYGYRNVEKKLQVTPQTLFAIGSVSKSFTVTLLGMLADDGELDWDTPVRDYLPGFRLHDEVATAEMTLRDLVTHRSGLPRHDLMWYGADYTRKEMFDRLRYLEPSKAFRSVWQYQNLMFMTAGYLAGQIEGSTWEALVEARIFKPLGMEDSNFSVETSQKAADFALPYSKSDDQVSLIPFRNIDEIGPAGSINSSVDQMIRYVHLHLNKGKYGEEQLLSETMAEQMQTPQMTVPGALRFEELGHTSYGMGLFVTTYRGEKLVHHGGGIDGFISFLSFMPQKKIGMIVLTNLSGNNPAPVVVSRNAYDRLLGLEPVDWVARVKEQEEKSKKTEEESRKEDLTPRKEGTNPSHALSDYPGTYEHSAYGKVVVALEEETLTLTFNSFADEMSHYHYDVFQVARSDRSPLSEKKVQFFYDGNGDINRLSVSMDTSVDDIVFERAADESLLDAEFLAQFVGEYSIGPQTIKISVKGEEGLFMSVTGQPTYTLVPKQGMTFDLTGLNGFSVEFKKNADGKVTELISHQPNGSFVAKKK